MTSLCCEMGQENDEYVEIQDEDVAVVKKSLTEGSLPFPDDVTCHISRYLTCEDLVRFSKTCKLAYALLKKYSYLDFYSRFIRIFHINLSSSVYNFWDTEDTPYYNVYRIEFRKGSFETLIYKKSVSDTYSSKGVVLKNRVFPDDHLVIGEILKVSITPVTRRPMTYSRYGVRVMSPRKTTKSQVVGAKFFGRSSGLTQAQVCVINEIVSKINDNIKKTRVNKGLND